MPHKPLLLFVSLALSTLFSSPVVASAAFHAASHAGFFPSCASNCPLLQNVESSCIRPDSQDETLSCFCHSSLIDQLHHSPNGTCDETCASLSDRDSLQTWYEGLCSSEGDRVKRDPTPAGEQPDGNAQTTATTTATATSTGKVKPHYPAPPSWWSTHYQWIIMVIVLIIGFTIITIAAVWLKRRHDAKYPHLYHASSRRSSGLLLDRQQQSSPTLNQQPGAFDPCIGMTEPRRFDGANTDSFASSSRTAVDSSRPGRSPFRMPRTAESQPSGHGGVGIREESR